MPKKIKISKKHHALIGVLVGSALMLLQAYGFSQSLESRSWPVTSGTVQSAGMVRAGTRRQRGRRHVKPKITYSFQVNGEKHTATRTEFGGFQLTWRYLHRLGFKHPLLKKYPKGSRVTVHYDPDSPKNATLSTGFPISGMICFFAGAAFAVASFPGEKKSGRSKEKKERERPVEDFRYAAHSGS